METVISVTVIIAYVIVLTFVALRARTAHEFEEFSLARRSLPLALVFGSLAATYVGPGFSIGFVGKGYNSGFLFLFIGLAYAIQNILVGLVIAPKLRSLKNCHTLGEAIGDARRHREGRVLLFELNDFFLGALQLTIRFLELLLGPNALVDIGDDTDCGSETQLAVQNRRDGKISPENGAIFAFEAILVAKFAEPALQQLLEANPVVFHIVLVDDLIVSQRKYLVSLVTEHIVEIGVGEYNPTIAVDHDDAHDRVIENDPELLLFIPELFHRQGDFGVSFLQRVLGRYEFLLNGIVGIGYLEHLHEQLVVIPVQKTQFILEFIVLQLFKLIDIAVFEKNLVLFSIEILQLLVTDLLSFH